MNTKPTLHDVALRAGVSPKTVSRVVNNERYVAPETQRRVREAVLALGFQPNLMAQNLRLGNAPPSIGLIIGDLSNPFYSSVARGVEEVARERDRSLIVASSEEHSLDEQHLVNALIAQRIDGIILVPAGGEQGYLAPALEHGAHVVCLDRPPQNLKTDAVLLDDVGGARRATEFLISRGHRRIGIVGDSPALYTARRRADGYRRALSNAGLPLDPELERLNSHTVADAERAAVELMSLKSPVTAVFATNNRNCIGVLRAASDRRHQNPPDIVGFDDFELARLLEIPVSVVAYDARKMGQRAAHILFDRLDGANGPPRRIRIATQLVHYGQR